MPTTCPVPVSGTLEADQAMPKSVILTVPSGATSTLPGLTSRCTIPAACAAASAAAVCRRTLEGAVGREPPLAAQQGGQRLALDQLHHQVGERARRCLDVGTSP